MSQQATTVPPKGLWALQGSDFLKGLIKAVAGLVVGLLIKIIHERQIPPYSEIEPILEAVVYFFVGYLGINTVTNNAGQMFKKDVSVVSVPAKDAAAANIPTVETPVVPPPPTP